MTICVLVANEFQFNEKKNRVCFSWNDLLASFENPAKYLGVV